MSTVWYIDIDYVDKLMLIDLSYVDLCQIDPSYVDLCHIDPRYVELCHIYPSYVKLILCELYLRL